MLALKRYTESILGNYCGRNTQKVAALQELILNIQIANLLTTPSRLNTGGSALFLTAIAQSTNCFATLLKAALGLGLEARSRLGRSLI